MSLADLADDDKCGANLTECLDKQTNAEEEAKTQSKGEADQES